MKIIQILLTFLFFFFVAVVSAQLNVFTKSADLFFKANVEKGKVNYTAIKNNATEINLLVKMIATTTTDDLSVAELKSFYVNAYNISVISMITKHYPISSPMDIAGFFEKNKLVIAGKSVTLDELENTVIRPQFKDPRLHFALVCGAIGCPEIVEFAYTPQAIEKQLEEKTKSKLNSNFVVVNVAEEKVELSEIFSWYKADFKINGQSEIDFINTYRDTKIPTHYTIKYYPYDWKLNDFTLVSDVSTSKITNLQTYTAGSLLKKGQVDFTLFNSVYTETKNNWLGVDYNDYRTTFSSSLLQFTYGISKNSKINIGVDVSLKAVAKNTSASPENIGSNLALQNNDSMRAGIAYIAPKIKFQPFNNPNFSIQSSVMISFAKSPEGYNNPDGSGNGNLYWIEWNRYVWWNQLFYSKMFANNKLQLFTEFDLLFRFKRTKGQTDHLDLPGSLFLSWFPTKKTTFYIMSQHVVRYVNDTGSPANTDWVVGANYTQSGAGFKYQVNPTTNIELLYTDFWRSVNNGKGQTFNLGLKKLF